VSRIPKIAIALILSVIHGFEESACQSSEPLNTKPNLLLIVADDLGYSDLGCFGAEIRTPNIDAIAARGLRGTNFYVSPTCSPSRSMLLSGTDNHIAGLGNMAEWAGPTQREKPGYEGYLNTRVVTIATLLREADYHTYAAAKWHLGEKPDQWPSRRGFERDFALLQGAGSHWSDMQGLLPSEPQVTFTRNGVQVKELPPDYYSSQYFTDFIIQSIDENSSDGKPFFAYLGYQAPHGPLAVPAEWLDKYQGRYDQGYDAIRAERLARQKKLGIVDQSAVAFPRLPNIPAWEDLTSQQRRESARKMELYAAMIECMDAQVGRLIDHLQKTGKLENTLIVFISDNGAAGEDMAELVNKLAPTAKDWFDRTFDNSPSRWGQPGSCMEYGPAWAQVSSVPFRLFKGVQAEGGIRSPFIVAGPGVHHAGTVNHSVLHVMDIVPTFLESAGVNHPASGGRSEFAPLQGKSMWPVLSGRSQSNRTNTDWIGWELFGNRAIRQGDWKLLYLLKGAGGTGDWELFNLREDPAELNDLSSKYPEKRKALLELWNQYVQKNGVIVSEAGPYAQQ
jgi:arylsulfatase